MAKWVHVRAPLPQGMRGYWRRWSRDAGMVCTDVRLPAEQADQAWIDALTDAEQTAEPAHEE